MSVKLYAYMIPYLPLFTLRVLYDYVTAELSYFLSLFLDFCMAFIEKYNLTSLKCQALRIYGEPSFN